MKKLVRYNLDRLDKIGANFNWILGERSNGKSYQIKHKKGVEKYLFNSKDYHAVYTDKSKVIEEIVKSGTRRFILLRRFAEEIKASIINQYFTDIDIVKLTDGKYNIINVYRQNIYLGNYNVETGKTTNDIKIGYVRALSTEQNYAGGSYLDVTDIIYEEVISRTSYIRDEPTKLMNFYSTIDRKRGIVRVWMAGNTISRVCPYFYEWGMDKMLRNMKQGEIKTRWMRTGEKDDNGKDIEVLMAIEYCKSTGNSSFVFGRHADMLNTGSWQTDPQPHLTKSRNSYKMLYKIYFAYQSFKFACEYLLDNDTKSTCWFIYPYTKGEIPKNHIVISDVIKESHYYQRDIYNVNIKNKKIVDLLKNFRECNIFYASDLCGTDFKQVIDFQIRK